MTLLPSFAILIAAATLSSPAVQKHQRLCAESGADACLIVVRGTVVQEWYSPRYREPMYAMSSTKSITAILMGMLVADGRIKSLDEPVCNWIAEWCDASRREVTLRHLLTMTSGLPRMTARSVGYTNDKNAFVIALKPTKPPGTAWQYSNEGVQLLSPILDRAAGEPIQKYARRRLFEPLGMMKTTLNVDAKGHAWTYADMKTTPRDLARIGELILADGKINGKQIVDAAWIRQMLTPSQNVETYGLLWWIFTNPRVYAALGHLETNLYVIPDAQIVVVRMQSKPRPGARDYWPAAREILLELIREASR